MQPLDNRPNQGQYFDLLADAHNQCVQECYTLLIHTPTVLNLWRELKGFIQLGKCQFIKKFVLVAVKIVAYDIIIYPTKKVLAALQLKHPNHLQIPDLYPPLDP